MKILPINKHTIDVFFNKGWEDHARFKINRTHHGLNVYQIAGSPVNRQTKLEIIKELQP